MNGITEIIAIDPGNQESGYCRYGHDKMANIKILGIDKISNEDLLVELHSISFKDKILVIEMIASYGMPCGKEVFETCVWIGRFIEAWNNKYELVYRKDIKIHFCQSMKAKDVNIIQALVDRFGDTNKHGKYAKGTNKNPGYFYGFAADMWQAFALAIYQYDKIKDIQ
jgi:hypothetical protein